MACTPLNIGVGFFVPLNWLTATTDSNGGVSVSKTAFGISVTGPLGTSFISLAADTIFHAFFGTPTNLLIMTAQNSAGMSTRRVSIVDLTSHPFNTSLILTVNAATSVELPVIKSSPGNGSAFSIWASDGTALRSMQIGRGTDGGVICSGPSTAMVTGAADAEATATNVIIHHPGVGSGSTPCPKPSGSCRVTPASRDFGEVVIGATPALATAMASFNIENNGNDCLVINSIGSVAPFNVITPIPADGVQLKPTDPEFVVQIQFNPGAVGNFGPTSLPVTRTPANGDNALVCEGSARAAIRRASVTSSVAFGTRPVGSSTSRGVTITNTGDLPVTANLGSQTFGAFQWPTVDQTIGVGGNFPFDVTFLPTAETAYSDSLTITTNGVNTPHVVPLSGTGCVANAAIVFVPPPAPIGFGQIQQGFRTVRFFKVLNTGDGALTFRARIQGPNAALFGLQPASGSIIDVLALRNYSVPPVTSCGPGLTGSGETIVAVAFFADAAPATVSAELFIDNHNATNVAVGSWTIPLSAEIIAGVAVDAAMVLDRSGSMGDPSGDRATKNEAEIAAGRLFVELSRPDVNDRLGIVRFNQNPDVLSGITVITAGNQTGIRNTINDANLNPSGATNIAGGVIVAIDELATPRTPPLPPDVKQVILVLTDGIDNRAYENPADSVWYSLAGGASRKPNGDPVNTTALSVPSGITIQSVGLGTSTNVNSGQLDLLSSGTDGHFLATGPLEGENYFAIEKLFTQIYMENVDLTTISDPVYTIHPGERHEIPFEILRGDVGGMVVVFDKQGLRLPFHLEAPNRELLEATSAPVGYQIRTGGAETSRFIEFKVPLGEPGRYAGTWIAVIEHRGEVCMGPVSGDDNVILNPDFTPKKCREWVDPLDYGIAIGAGSNLRMQAFVTPGIVRTGEPILLTAVLAEASLRLAGGTVTVYATVPSGATWTLSLYDDGFHDDVDPDDGEYAAWFNHTAEEGSYQFLFRGEVMSRDNEPVVRELTRSKYVEGRVPIVPDPLDGEGGRDDSCCRDIKRYVLIGLVLLLLLVLAVWFR